MNPRFDSPSLVSLEQGRTAEILGLNWFSSFHFSNGHAAGAQKSCFPRAPSPSRIRCHPPHRDAPSPLITTILARDTQSTKLVCILYERIPSLVFVLVHDVSRVARPPRPPSPPRRRCSSRRPVRPRPESNSRAHPTPVRVPRGSPRCATHPVSRPSRRSRSRVPRPRPRVDGAATAARSPSAPSSLSHTSPTLSRVRARAPPPLRPGRTPRFPRVNTGPWLRTRQEEIRGAF